MKITKKTENLEKSAVKLTVTIEKSEVDAAYNELLLKYAKNAQIPGFRKGHVPPTILERKFGEAILKESNADLIEKSLNEIFSQEESREIRPLPYSQPKIEELGEISKKSDLTFSVVYDVFPKVEIKDFNGIEIENPQVQITEQEINEELQAIRERNAVVVDKKEGSAVENGDVVTIDYCEKDDSGVEIAGSKREGFVFTVGTGENIYKVDEDIIGMKNGETKTFEKNYAENDSNPDLAGKTKKIEVKIAAVKIRDLPALDDDLAQDVNEKYKTLDDLKKSIRENLEVARDRKISELKNNSLLEQLIQKNPFELPQSMILAELDSRWRMTAQQFGVTSEQFEKMMASSGQDKQTTLESWKIDCEQALKSRIIVEELIRVRNISVTTEEIEAEYEKIAVQSQSSVEDVKKHYADVRSNEYLIDEIKERKLFEILYGEVKILKSKKVSFKELFEPKKAEFS